MKDGEQNCSKKRKKRKEKSEENENGCDSEMRKTQKEVKDEKLEKEKDKNVDERRRRIIEATEEKNDDDLEPVIEDVEIQGSGWFGDKLKKKKSGVNKAGLVLGTRYTKEEDEIIKKAVLDFVEKHKLGDKGIDMVMNCSQHPNLRGCWNEICAEILPQRCLTSIYARAHVVLDKINRGRWTKEEINYIKETYNKHGADWKLMAKKLGRHRHHVYSMYRFTKLPNLSQGHWLQDEYQTLFDLVHADLEAKVFLEQKKKSPKHGNIKDNICWVAVSDKLGTRHHLRCCNKWYQRLSSPMVVDGTWADADDYRMLIALDKLDASCEEEVDWDALIEHRTGEFCRKRWKQMVRHIGENRSKSFIQQVEVLSQRYCPKMLQVREQLDTN